MATYRTAELDAEQTDRRSGSRRRRFAASAARSHSWPWPASRPLAWLALRHRQPATVPPRNVLLITIDTLRADALGAYGNASAATPWIDRLAAGGVRFSTARAHNVLTLPSHANILTGRLPPDHGVRDNAGFRLPPAEATLATRLKARGFHTGAFVSAFPLDSRFGLARGLRRLRRRLRGCGAASGVPRAGTRGNATTVAAALRWLRGRRTTAEPWFAWVHLYEPHYPYAPPEPFAIAIRARPRMPAKSPRPMRRSRPLLQPILDAGAADRHARDRDRRSRRVARRSRRSDARHLCLRGDAARAAHRLLPAAHRRRLSSMRPRVTSISCRRSSTRSACRAAEGLRGRSLLRLARGNGDRRGRRISKRSRDRSTAAGRRSRASSSNGLKYIDLPIPELYDLRRRSAGVAQPRRPRGRSKSPRIAARCSNRSRTARSERCRRDRRGQGAAAGSRATSRRRIRRAEGATRKRTIPKRLIARRDRPSRTSLDSRSPARIATALRARRVRSRHSIRT